MSSFTALMKHAGHTFQTQLEGVKPFSSNFAQLINPSRMHRQAFETYLYSENREGSGKASSYLKALYWLQEMLKIESYGFDDMLDIWSVNNVDRLIELRERVLQEQKKGADTPL